MVKRLVTLLVVPMAILVTSCATRFDADGRKENRFDPRYLAKSDIDRVVDTDRTEVMAGMRHIAVKLYKRNPKEWKKSGQPNAAAALDRLFAGSLNFPELEGRREGAAALYAFSANYQGAVSYTHLDVYKRQTQTLTRRADFDFSLMTFVDGAGLLFRAGENPKSMEELKGQRIVVVGGTTTEKTMEAFVADTKLGVKLIKAKDHDTAMASLQDKTATDVYKRQGRGRQ